MRRLQSGLRLVLGIMALASFASRALHAQGATSRTAPGIGAQPARTTAPESVADDPLSTWKPPAHFAERPTVIVLRTGQVLTARIEPELGGYALYLPTGRTMVPYDQVWTAATSVSDAYARIVSTRQNPTTNERLELARWCFQNDLPEEARVELSAALQLEPTRPKARMLLHHLEQSLQRKGRLANPEAAAKPTAAQVTGGRSGIGGLSTRSSSDYVRVIQPILMHRCGNAACHGTTSDNAFRLLPTSTTQAGRSSTSANLTAVLQLIDASAPDTSPILTASQVPLGPHRTAWQGRAGAENFTTLRDWVRAVSAELPASSSVAVQTATSPRPENHPLVAAVPAPLDLTLPQPVSSHSPAGAVVPIRDASVITAGGVVPPDGKLSHSTGSAPGAVSASEAFLQRILSESAADPFDPEEFNRMMHPR